MIGSRWAPGQPAALPASFGSVSSQLPTHPPAFGSFPLRRVESWATTPGVISITTGTTASTYDTLGPAPISAGWPESVLDDRQQQTPLPFRCVTSLPVPAQQAIIEIKKEKNILPASPLGQADQPPGTEPPASPNEWPIYSFATSMQDVSSDDDNEAMASDPAKPKIKPTTESDQLDLKTQS